MGGWRNTTASGISGDLKRSLFHTSRLIFSVTIARYSQSQLQPKSNPNPKHYFRRQDRITSHKQSRALSYHHSLRSLATTRRAWLMLQVVQPPGPRWSKCNKTMYSWCHGATIQLSTNENKPRRHHQEPGAEVCVELYKHAPIIAKERILRANLMLHAT